MLPPNIDLTESSDFGLGSGISMDTPVDLDDLDTRNNMSIDEYDYLVWWEGIFGRKRHHNQKWNIFPRIGLDVPYDPDKPNYSHCVRCGKEIKIPWKNYYGLCFECNNKIETTVDSKIPWNHTVNFSFRNDERGYNLFNSK
jgi:hypothetical protein